MSCGDFAPATLRNINGLMSSPSIFLLASSQSHSKQLGNRRKDVHGHHRLVAHGAGRNLAGPTHETRHPLPAIPGRALAVGKRLGLVGMIAVGKPMPVVGRDRTNVRSSCRCA